MLNQDTVKLLSELSLSMFTKNFFGIFQGAISAKLDHKHFMINSKDAVFDNLDDKSFCTLNMNKPDYRWNIASLDAYTHSAIYTNIHEAKYIAFGMPIYTTAYTLGHDNIIFEDYFGKMLFGEVPIYNPGDLSTWKQRSALEITKSIKNTEHNLLVIKGIGTYIYDRDIHELVKKIAILENSCRLLSIKSTFR